jgi:hypothetical protein
MPCKKAKCALRERHQQELEDDDVSSVSTLSENEDGSDKEGVSQSDSESNTSVSSSGSEQVVTTKSKTNKKQLTKKTHVLSPTPAKQQTIAAFKNSSCLISRVRNSLLVMLLEIDASYGDLITPQSFQKFVADNSSSLRGVKGLLVSSSS